MAEVLAVVSEMEKLGRLLVDKANLKKEVKWEVEKLMNEMKSLVGLVREKKLEEGSCRLKCLISEVVEMARRARHQIEEVDDIDNRIAAANVGEIKETNERLQESGVDGSQNYGVGEGDGDVVGFDEDVKLLLRKMEMGSFRGPFVACINGIDGSGKTTLARKINNYAEAFEHRAWINCAEFLCRKELLVNLLRRVMEAEVEGAVEMERAHLQKMLSQRLRGKRYFIVLDDIRRFTYLDFVIQSLQDEDKKGKLLVTTHTGMIARKYYPLVNYFHDMKPLDPDTSWELLQKTILSGNIFPKKLERKGKQMLMKHSGGMPLAVKEVAMEWAEKRRLGTEWEEVIESEDLEMRASLAAVESSCFKYLESDAKSCFLHLGFFRQGTTIRAEKLVQIWIAGLVVSQVEQTTTCIRSFIKQNIIEVKDKAKDSRIKNCRIGAIFHKLSVMKSPQQPRHRVIYCSRERVSNCTMNQEKQLVSLFYQGGGFFDARVSHWKCFEQLRVLDLEGFGVKFLPGAISVLIELRYLGLRNNYIQKLPRSMICLKNLEVLDIAQNFMVEVPDIICEMKRLCHLYMSDIICRKPLRIEEMQNIETLTYISIDNWAYEESGLQMMNRLRKLGIEGLDENTDVSKLFASLDKLYLKCLILKGFRFRSLPSLDKLKVLEDLEELKLDGPITRLPSAEDFPLHLSHLTLVNSRLDEDPMPVLEKVFSLRYLKLQNAYTGPVMVISTCGFPRLNQLCISELWHLRNICVGSNSFWQFLKVEINNCPYLETLPGRDGLWSVAVVGDGENEKKKKMQQM